jgi:hypothetical protein
MVEDRELPVRVPEQLVGPVVLVVDPPPVEAPVAIFLLVAKVILVTPVVPLVVGVVQEVPAEVVMEAVEVAME